MHRLPSSQKVIKVFTNFSLKHFNTFHVEAFADKFLQFDSRVELQKWLKSEKTLEKNEFLVMGGGSNLLFTSDFHGTIIHPMITGIELIGEEGDDVLVRLGAGEQWDHCVAWAVENGLGGIENLSLIPGMAGAAPVQNIGAYGVELKDVMVWAEGLWLKDGASFRLYNHECSFDYRYSIFKGPLKNQTVITSVVVRLQKKPVFQLEYGTVSLAVEERGGVSLKNIRDAVVEIRASKLPDPDKLGNAGSFFKNPVIDAQEYRELLKKFPKMPGYPLPHGERMKVPAGWLIEQGGWKGSVRGRAGVHVSQALVLVNHGGATGSEILALAQAIESDVCKKFGIQLEREVNVY